MLTALKTRARALKREAYALSIAMRDPRTPWYAKAFLALVVAHTFSPIDLIPDFIPVLGYLDDLIITPLGIFLALKMTPPAVMAEARQQAANRITHEKPVSWAGAVLVIGVWIITISVIGWLSFNLSSTAKTLQYILINAWLLAIAGSADSGDFLFAAIWLGIS